MNHAVGGRNCALCGTKLMRIQRPGAQGKEVRHERAESLQSVFAGTG